MSVATAVGHSTVDARLEAGGGILLLTLGRPKANILTMEMVGELGDALEVHRDLPGLKLVVLRGAGSQFSFGASVEEHRQEKVAAMLAGFHRFIRQLVAYPVATAALVEGNCLGGGFEVALCCSFLFAAPGARFACPEIKLGVFPPVLAALGARRLGGFLAEGLLLTGETLGAEELERRGLLTALFAAGEDPWEGLLAWYRKRLEPLSAFVLRQASDAARGSSGWLAELARTLDAAERLYLERLLPSHDGNEGIEAFLGKRPPQWQDR